MGGGGSQTIGGNNLFVLGCSASLTWCGGPVAEELQSNLICSAPEHDCLVFIVVCIGES